MRPISSLKLSVLLLLIAIGCSNNTPSMGDVNVIQIPGGGMVPDAEVDAEGTLHLAYLLESDIYYVTSTDEGHSFSEPLRVNTEPGFAFGGRYAGPDVAIGKDGVVHIVWDNAAHQQKRDAEEWGVMYARLLPGAVAFEPSRNLSHVMSENFSVATDGEGQVSVIWMSDSLYVSQSNNGGDSFQPALAMDVDQCECCGSRALYSDEGTLFVMYRDKADNIRDMHLASMQKGEDSFSQLKLSQTPWPIEGCPMTGSYLTYEDDQLLAAWETEGQVFMGYVTAKEPALVSGEIKVTDKGKYPVALRAGNGNTLVAWKAGQLFNWQFVDGKGILQGHPDTLRVDSPHRPGGAVTLSGKILLFP